LQAILHALDQNTTARQYWKTALGDKSADPKLASMVLDADGALGGSHVQIKTRWQAGISLLTRTPSQPAKKMKTHLLWPNRVSLISTNSSFDNTLLNAAARAAISRVTNQDATALSCCFSGFNNPMDVRCCSKNRRTPTQRDMKIARECTMVTARLVP